MPISWEYYAKRRRIQVDSWVKRMKFKSYDQFLSYLSSEDIRPPASEDVEVKKCIEDLKEKTASESDTAKAEVKKTASQKRSRSRGKSEKE